MAFPATYPIRPIHPSPIVTWRNGMLNAVRQFQVPTEYVDEFIEDMLSTGGSACGLPGTFPGWPLVFIDEIRTEPISPCCMVSPGGEGVLTNPLTELEGYPLSGSVSDDPNNGEWCWSKVVVTYNTREVLAGQSGVREGTWVTYDRNMSGEMTTLPGRNLYWEGSSLPIKHDTDVAKFVPLGDINLNWAFVEEDDMCETETNLLTMQGRVNDAAWGGFLFPGVCSDMWPAETLLFLGYSTSLEIGSRAIFGTYCSAVEKKRTLKLAFKLRRIFAFDAVTGGSVVGWNHRFYDGGQLASGWRRIVDENGDPQYESTSFANMFI